MQILLLPMARCVDVILVWYADMRPQRNTYVYTAFTQNYKYSTIVHATSVKQARAYGYREALAVMGRCAVIRRDLVEQQK